MTSEEFCAHALAETATVARVSTPHDERNAGELNRLLESFAGEPPVRSREQSPLADAPLPAPGPAPGISSEAS
jgi:hypothetical protein